MLVHSAMDTNSSLKTGKWVTAICTLYRMKTKLWMQRWYLGTDGSHTITGFQTIGAERASIIGIIPCSTIQF